MPDYLVFVTFELEPGGAGRFLPLVRRQAALSRAEPGCRTFDVWTDSATPDRVALYEIYTDRAAFDAHLETAHLAEFNAAAASLVRDKTIVTCDAREGVE